MRSIWTAALSFALGTALAAEPPAPPVFTKKPMATKAGDVVKIEFAASRETDVAVFIEDGKGQVIRHLVAGVLGKNPPAPLAPGLAQSIEWDGKADYGKAAPAGPFKVRVALGLSAKYDKVLISDPNTIGGIAGLAAGPDGTVYVMHGTGGAVSGVRAGGGGTIRAFNRDGSYQRTVMPFPSSLAPEQMKLFGPLVGTDGRLQPLGECLGVGSSRKSKMAVTPDGIFLWLSGNQLLGVRTTGTVPGDVFSGPGLPGAARERACVAAAADGKTAFVGGLGRGNQPLTAVYRVKLPERTAEVFFGDPAKAGNDETHLGAAGATGLAADGKGHVLIGDPANGRVLAVDEKDGKFAGSFAVAGPDGIAVDPAGGAVYVLAAGRGDRADLLKFSPSTGSGPGGGWKDAKEQARLPVTGIGNPDFPPNIALDASAKPAVVWVATDSGRLIRVEDAGDKLTAKEVGNGNIGNAVFHDITVDRFRPDREIYSRLNAGGSRYFRVNEETGKLEVVALQNGGTGFLGTNVVPAPDGNLYSLRWPYMFFKHDRNGKALTWEEPRRAEVTIPESGGKKYVWRPVDNYVPVSMGSQPHTLGARGSDGHIFTMEPANPGGRPPKGMYEYLPTGKRVSDDPIVWKVSDAALGPRFDAAGNIYIADVVRPMNWLYPPEFDRAFPTKVEINKTRPSGAQDAVANMYGSIVKFSPKGGIIDYKLGSDKSGDMVPHPYKGEPKLDPALKSMDVSWYACTSWRGPEKVIGAEWIHPGISRVGLIYCNCENVNFDVDEFGRVFFPDLYLYQVRVIDTAGNELTKFGGYGNADSCGPDSPVIDPTTKKLRPRRPEDPKELKSPFAEPEIAFAWLMSVGVTDRYAYCGDSMNRRLLRAKLVYAAEETCEVK